MAFSDTWNGAWEIAPADIDDVGDGASEIRELKLAIRERLEADHYFDPAGTDADHGEHKQITLHEPIATPGNIANKAFLYGKDVGDKIELHFLDEDDNEIQLTSAGLLNPALLLDEDDMASDSEDYAPTQQSVKAFMGSHIENIWIPAGSLIPLGTNGAEASTWEHPNNLIIMDLYAFDGATVEAVAFNIALPDGWDLGTIRAKFYWSPGDVIASAGDKVEWGLAALAIADDDAIDAALGTPQIIYDTVLAGVRGDMHITDPIPALTVGGTPTLGELTHFKIYRNTGSANDDMTEDAWLFGVMLELMVDQTVTAWA